MNRTTAMAGGLMTIAIGGTCLQVLLATPGCAAAERVGTLETSIETLGASVETIEAAVAHVETTVGTIAIGGGTDSVTAWIYALGAVAAMLFYPLIWRPAARTLGLRRNPPATPDPPDPPAPPAPPARPHLDTQA